MREIASTFKEGLAMTSFFREASNSSPLRDGSIMLPLFGGLHIPLLRNFPKIASACSAGIAMTDLDGRNDLGFAYSTQPTG